MQEAAASLVAAKEVSFDAAMARFIRTRYFRITKTTKSDTDGFPCLVVVLLPAPVRGFKLLSTGSTGSESLIGPQPEGVYQHLPVLFLNEPSLPKHIQWALSQMDMKNKTKRFPSAASGLLYVVPPRFRQNLHIDAH